jgi:hypothetical protein
VPPYDAAVEGPKQGRGSTVFGRARSRRAIVAYGIFVVALILLFVADGSRQPTSGPGWRILGYQRGVAGKTDVVRLADQADLDAAWDRLLLQDPPPPLPVGATTLWLTATGTLGCPAHFAGIDRDPSGIVATFTRALTEGCDSLRVPDSFLVTIDGTTTGAAPFDVTRVAPSDAPMTITVGP